MKIGIAEAIQRTVEHREVFHDEMLYVMRQIMTGEATPAQIEIARLAAARDAKLWWPGGIGNQKYVVQCSISLQHPEALGELTLRSANPADKPKIWLNLYGAQADVDYAAGLAQQRGAVEPVRTEADAHAVWGGKSSYPAKKALEAAHGLGSEGFARAFAELHRADVRLVQELRRHGLQHHREAHFLRGRHGFRGCGQRACGRESGGALYEGPDRHPSPHRAASDVPDFGWRAELERHVAAVDTATCHRRHG